jgi:hypothetical protein
MGRKAHLPPAHRVLRPIGPLDLTTLVNHWHSELALLLGSRLGFSLDSG